MANELAVIEDNWLELAGKYKDLPMPFEQTVFLAECHLAGTELIEDMVVKTENVDAGTPLTLKRTNVDAEDDQAIAALTAAGDIVGYVPRRYAALMARLMDAGKALAAKVTDKVLAGHWIDISVAIEMKEA